MYQRNIQFLEDYLRSDWPIRPEAQKHVRALVTASPGIRLSEIFRETGDVMTRDDLFAMIAIGTLDIDLSSAPLTEPDKIHLHLNRPNDEHVPASNGSGPGASSKGLLPQMGPVQVAEANRRLRLIQTYEARQPLEDNVSARTVRHWLHRYRHAEAMQGDGYLGLLPRFHDCGNRNSKLPEKTKALMLNIIGTDYETLKQKRKFHVYGALIRACESEGTVAPSYKTFSLAINRRLQSELVFNRRGRRAAYQVQVTLLGTAPHNPAPR